MAVDTEHPEYTALLPVWKQMRDCVAGQRAIHAARETYLPRLVDEPDDKYAARLKRSSFFNATARTVEGLSGMVFRTAPAFEVSTAAEPMLKDVTMTGISEETLAKLALNEVLIVARTGLMVDYPTADTEGLTVAQAEAMNLRPRKALYRTEAIINWDYAWIDNAYRLSLVVLVEYASVPGKDEFDRQNEKRWRVLDLVPGENGGRAYRQRLFRKTQGGADEQIGPDMFPKMKGATLDYIPFEIVTIEDATTDTPLPPLLDLADVNLSHYRSTSDRKHGAHQTALPQPWVTGVNPQIGPDGQPVKSKMYIGGGELWTFPKDAQVGMLEYTGQGLQTLKEEIEREENQMAVLGARMLERQKNGVEAAETAGIHRAGEQSVLAALAGSVSRSIQKTLAWFDMWAGGDGNVSFELNRDYFPQSLDAPKILALVQAWQSGALAKEEMFLNFQAGGIVRESTTYADSESMIEASAPTLAPAPNASNTPPEE